jgi:hypothetical protein
VAQGDRVGVLDNLALMATGAAGSERDRPPEIPPLTVPVDETGGDEDPPPRTLADAWTWLVVAFVGLLGGELLSILILYGVANINGHVSNVSALVSRAVPPAWVVISTLIGLWIGFVGAPLWASFMVGTGSIVRDMGLRFRPWDPLIGIAAGLGGQFILITLLYLPWEHFDPGLSQKLAQPAKHLTGGFPGVDLAVIAVLTVVVVPVVEELFFRGLVLRGFVRLFAGAGRIVGPVLAVTATGIVFGLAHFELLELLGLAAFGIVLSVMAYRFKRLGPGIFAHATFNLAAILDIAHQSGLVR